MINNFDLFSFLGVVFLAASLNCLIFYKVCFKYLNLKKTFREVVSFMEWLRLKIENNPIDRGEPSDMAPYVISSCFVCGVGLLTLSLIINLVGSLVCLFF